MFGKIQHKTTKGYAFVRPTKTGNDTPLQDYFLYHKEFSGDWETLKTGDLIEFTPGVRKGNPNALEVRLLADASEKWGQP